MDRQLLSASPGSAGTFAGPRRAALARLWSAPCIGGFLGLCWLLRGFATDDAWISVRYADNLATGRGLVWNPGGPPVEGFSNPGLVGLEAVARLDGVAPLDAARAAGVIAGVLLLLAMASWAPAVAGPVAARVGLALTALSAPFALWAMGGLETVPAALSLLAGTLLLCRPAVRARDAILAGAALAALPWLRPEGIVVALALTVAAEGPGLRRRDGRAVALRRLTFAAGPPVLSQLVLEGLRLAAFGHLLPNSVVYKTGIGLTLEVLAKFALLAAPVAALALVGAWRAPGRLRLLAVPPAVYVLGSLAMFDSANHFSRFFLPTWPEWALLAGIALAAMRARAGAAVIGGVVLTMLLVVPGNAWWVRRWSERYATCLEGARERAARWLSAHTPPRAAFSISDAGLVPAKAGGRAAIDDFLLNEPVIQRTGPLHVRQRVPMILGRRPDLVVLLSDRADRFNGPYAIDRGLARDPRMRAYRLAAVARGDGTGCHYDLFIYQRRDMRRRRSP